MERESAVLRHKEVVQPFIKAAFKEGAHRIKPRHISHDQWVMQIMIGVEYNDVGNTATFQELAEKRGAFKQSISSSNRRFLINLWNNSSQQLQEQYPLEEILSARKSLSQRSRERISLSGGGTSLKIKEQVNGGITNVGTINKNTGIAKNIIRRRATTLKDWGIIIPRELASHREVLQQLGKETDDKKIQELLDRIPLYVVSHNLKREREASQFSSLSLLTREAGFRSRDKLPFATSLKSAGVPISIKERVVKGGIHNTYYVVLSRHKDRVIQVLQEDQGLQKFQRE